MNCSIQTGFMQWVSLFSNKPINTCLIIQNKCKLPPLFLVCLHSQNCTKGLELREECSEHEDVTSWQVCGRIPCFGNCSLLGRAYQNTLFYQKRISLLAHAEQRALISIRETK